MRKQIIAGIWFLREPERARFKLSGKPLKRMENLKSETETAYLFGYLSSYDSHVYGGYGIKRHGYSVRCLRD